MREATRRKTIDLCFHKEQDGSPCGDKVLWKLKGSTDGKAFKVCDLHLPWGIRLSGYPALVDKFDPDPEE